MEQQKETGVTVNRLEDLEFRKGFENFFEEKLLELVTEKENEKLLKFDPEETMRRFRDTRKVWLKNNDAFITRIGQDYRLTPDEIEYLYMNWL